MFREPEVELVRHWLSPEALLVDVGANTGVYSRAATDRGARVVAFEPLAELARDLQRDLGPAACVYGLAVGTDEGVTTIYVPLHGDREVSTRASLSQSANGDMPLAEHIVSVVRLDRMVRDATLVKIDVEGRELDALRSADALLRRRKPDLLVEIEQRHHSREEGLAVFDLLRELGYAGFFLRNLPPRPRLTPLEEFDFDVHQDPANQKPIGQEAAGEYVNNFIFTTPERVPELLAAVETAFGR